MEDGRSGLDLTTAAWSRGGKKEWQRLLAAAALGAHVRERREAGKSRRWPFRPGKIFALLNSPIIVYKIYI